MTPAQPSIYFITGASRGIGLELTRQALQGGYTVVAVARDPQASDGLRSLAGDFAARLRLTQANVGRDEDIARLAQELGDLPRLDVLINNAGVNLEPDQDFPGIDLERVAETLAINSLAPMRVTRAFLPLLERAPAPRLVNISSLMGSIADNGSGGAYAYRMSKTALNMFTRTFALDYPRVTAIAMHPGWVKTDMGGGEAPLEIPDSARGILKVIAGLSARDTGKFLDYEGDTLPW